MSAKVQFLSRQSNPAAASQAPVLTLPLTAVTTRDGRNVVLVVREGKVQETPIAAGEVLGDRVIIREGVAQGDQVVARPDPSLATGTAITPREHH
jgi:hypothetical protein